IIPFSMQRAPFDRRVLDEVHRPPIRLEGFDLQMTRQLKQQRPFSSAANSNIHLCRYSQHRRRLDRRLNSEARNRDVLGPTVRSREVHPGGRKRSPQIEKQDAVFCSRLPRPQRLGACCIPEHLKTTQSFAQQMSVQQRRKFSIAIAATLQRKEMAEVQQQAQSVELGESAARIAPFLDEFRALRRWRQRAL